jgi:hypothetical protein
MSRYEHARSAVALFVAALLCFSAVTAGVAVAENGSDSDVSTQSAHIALEAADVEVAPGGMTELEFEIENTGSDTAGVDLSASSLYEFDGAITVEEFDADGAVWYESDRYWAGAEFSPVQLDAGETRTPSITVSVAESAAGQSFDVSIESLEQNVSDTATISVSDDGSASDGDDGDAGDTREYTELSLEADEVEAAPGDVVDLGFEITNTGNETTDVGLDASGASNADLPDNVTTIQSFNADDGVWYESDRYWEASEIAPDESQSPSLTIAVAENATAGSFDLPVELTDRPINETAVLTITDDGADSGDDDKDSNNTTGGVTVERTPEATTVAPGESIDVTVDVASDQQNIEILSESLRTNTEAANITDASSEAAQVATEFPSDSAEVVYLSPVDGDTLTYTVSVSEDATDGDTIELAGTAIDSDSNETETGTTTIEVSRFSTDREPTTETASPGDTVDVSVSVTGADASIDLLAESVASEDTENLEIVDASADTAQAVINDDGSSVSVPHTESVDAVNLSYTLAVSENATVGETLNASGSVAGASSTEVDTGTTTIEVTDNPYANEQGQVDTNGLVKAITDWRDAGLSVQELLDVIEQWRSRSL